MNPIKAIPVETKIPQRNNKPTAIGNGVFPPNYQNGVSTHN
jgi:hypothetical protein